MDGLPRWIFLITLLPPTFILPSTVKGNAKLFCLDWEGKKISNGETFMPDRKDPCKTCNCDNGQQTMCASVSCSPQCNGGFYKQIEGKCCEFICLDDTQPGPRDRTNMTGANPTDVEEKSPVTVLGLRLVASSVTSLLILSLLIFMIHRLRQRRLLLSRQRFTSSHHRLDEADGSEYMPDPHSINIQIPPYEDPPPPYSPPKPEHTNEPPPPYDSVDRNGNSTMTTETNDSEPDLPKVFAYNIDNGETSDGASRSVNYREQEQTGSPIHDIESTLNESQIDDNAIAASRNIVSNCICGSSDFTTVDCAVPRHSPASPSSYSQEQVRSTVDETEPKCRYLPEGHENTFCATLDGRNRKARSTYAGNHRSLDSENSTENCTQFIDGESSASSCSSTSLDTFMSTESPATSRRAGNDPTSDRSEVSSNSVCSETGEHKNPKNIVNNENQEDCLKIVKSGTNHGPVIKEIIDTVSVYPSMLKKQPESVTVNFISNGSAQASKNRHSGTLPDCHESNVTVKAKRGKHFKQSHAQKL